MNEEARGAWASRPSSLRYPAWREIAWRVWTNSGTHNVGLMAAGIGFYAFLSFVPLLGSLVMTYGLVADPSTVAEHMDVAVRHLPRSASNLVNDQLLNLTSTAAEKKGLGLLLALAVAIFGATRASGALISALNVVYEQNDRRGFLRGFGLATVLILCIMAVGLLGLVAASLYAFMGDIAAELGWAWATMLRLLAWLAAGSACILSLAAIYRFVPDREEAKWRWLTIGSVVATTGWLLATLGFGLYAANFGKYNATYGSLGAVVVLLIWLYLSAYALLLGALVNAEVERQVAIDTTTAPEKPIGKRGAVMADMSIATGEDGARRDGHRDG